MNCPTLFCNLQQFIQIQGCQSQAGSVVKYEHSSTVNELQSSIAQVIENQVLEDVANVKVCSIICDETCDLANIKHLGVNIRYTKNGSVVVKFLENLHISDGTAQTLMSAIQNMLNNKNINMNKVIALGCDGANVMLGKTSGLAKRLQDINPSLIAVHCSAHRLSLVLQHAVKDIQTIKSFNENIKAIFVFFNASAVRSAKLMMIQKLVQKTSLKYPELHTVRWMSLHKAVKVIYKTLDSLIIFLESQSAEGKDATAPGLLRAVRHIRFAYITHILNDILPILTELSKKFQYDTADVLMVKPSIDTSITRLSLLKENPRVIEKDFIENVINHNNLDQNISFSTDMPENEELENNEENNENLSDSEDDNFLED